MEPDVTTLYLGISLHFRDRLPQANLKETSELKSASTQGRRVFKNL